MMRRFRRDTFDLIVRGTHLSTTEASALLSEAAEGPAGRDARLAVLGTHVLPDKVRGLQVLWFIENEPWTSLGMYAVNLDPSTQQEQAAELWRHAIRRHPTDLRVFENAIWFFIESNPADALSLLDARIVSSPDDPDVWELAAIVFEFMANTDPETERLFSERALDAAFQVFAKDNEPQRRLELLLIMRVVASRIPHDDKLRLLDLASRSYQDALEGSSAARRQGAEVALGFLALADGRPDRALHYLTESLQFSFVSDHVGSLAQALIAHGLDAEVRERLAGAQRATLESSELLKSWLATVPSE